MLASPLSPKPLRANADSARSRAAAWKQLRIAAGLVAGPVLDAVLPQTCVGCGTWIAGAGLICPACHASVADMLARPACRRCGRTLPQAAIHPEGCARCRTERFWNVAGVARIGVYRPPLREMLLGLKYANRLRAAEYLGDMLAEAVERRGWADQLDAVVPVPSHWLRRWQRPADHAWVLADALGCRLKRPVVRLVRRARYAPSQAGVPSKAQRFENVRDCFVARPAWFGRRRLPSRQDWRSWWRNWWPRPVAGSGVLIVDNILVSGATICEVSKVLRRMGVRRIYAAVAARPAAPGDPPSGWLDESGDFDLAPPGEV